MKQFSCVAHINAYKVSRKRTTNPPNLLEQLKIWAAGENQRKNKNSSGAIDAEHSGHLKKDEAEGFPSSSTSEFNLDIKWKEKAYIDIFMSQQRLSRPTDPLIWLDFTFSALATQPSQPSTILDSFSQLFIPSPCCLPSPSVRYFFSITLLSAFHHHHLSCFASFRFFSFKAVLGFSFISVNNEKATKIWKPSYLL